jgi:hypothetical protein
MTNAEYLRRQYQSQQDRYLRRSEAADYLKSKFGHGSKRTLAKLATIGGGPVFRKVGKLVVYTTNDLDIWALSLIGPAQNSTSDTRAK